MTVINPKSLGNRRFVVQEGRIRFFAASKAVVVVGTYGSNYQICQIVFNKKDGSLFVSTPYFGTGSGIVTSASIGSGPPCTISLREGGMVTSHLVKLSHHPHGRVHFSQTGKVKTEIIRPSFRLADSIGEVFELHIYHAAGFEALDLAMRKTDRVYLRYVFKGALPAALTITAEWRRKAAVQANTDPPNGIVPPVTSVKHRKTGVESLVTLFGQPPGWPLRDHVLMLSCHATTSLKNIERPTMILMGGWDPAEVSEVGQEVKQTGCLLWLYPIEEAEMLAQQIGSIDLVGPAGTA